MNLLIDFLQKKVSVEQVVSSFQSLTLFFLPSSFLSQRGDRFMRIFGLIGIILLFGIQSQSFMPDCPDYDYKENGWIIHNSTEFDKILNDVRKLVADGINNSTLVRDLDSFMVTNNSKISPDLFMKVDTWDMTSTSQELMYGDIAILTDLFTPENALEVRWFDGKNKHLVFNDMHMYCISTKQPNASNTIF